MVDFKSNLRKKSDPSSSTTFTATTSSKGEPLAEETPIVDFKAKLRKSTKPDNTNSAKEDISSEPIDFKSRLRKVSGSKDKSSSSPTKDIEQLKLPILDKRDSLGNGSNVEASAVTEAGEIPGEFKSFNIR